MRQDLEKREGFVHKKKTDKAMPRETREVRLLLAHVGATMGAAFRATEELGDERVLLRTGFSGLAAAGLSRFQASLLVECRVGENHLRHEEELLRRGGRTLVFGEEGFPTSLTVVPDPPAALFVKGRLPGEERPGVAVIGLRRCSPEGERLAGELASKIAWEGCTVVSGLARGIDAAALKGCLRGDAPAVGVLGSGLDFVYPPENGTLFREIEEAGALVSEFPLGVSPRKWLFPRRNRLISGLARGVLVVEAAARSGTLITVDHAIDQGRTVMAVPGAVDRSCCRGTNRLIRDGACVILSVEDVFAALGIFPGTLLKKERGRKGEETQTHGEDAVLGFCRQRAVTPDQIARQSGLAVKEILEALARLEARDMVRRHPGGRFLSRR